MDARYHGPSNIGGLVSYVKSVTVERNLPAFFLSGAKAPALPEDSRNATLSATFHETRGLLSFVMPGMAIANGTDVNLDIDNDGMLLGYVNSPSLDFNNIHGSNIKLSVSNQDDVLNCTVNAGQLKVNTLTFDNAGINLDADGNLAKLGVRYAGANLLDNGSELNLQALLQRAFLSLRVSLPSCAVHYNRRGFRQWGSSLRDDDGSWEKASRVGIGRHL